MAHQLPASRSHLLLLAEPRDARVLVDRWISGEGFFGSANETRWKILCPIKQSVKSGINAPRTAVCHNNHNLVVAG